MPTKTWKLKDPKSCGKHCITPFTVCENAIGIGIDSKQVDCMEDFFEEHRLNKSFLNRPQSCIDKYGE